jgi:hypothetical protein
MTATPSARVRLAVAAVSFCILGLGPAVAWDMTSQPPRAEPRSAWPRPSPWKQAGAQMKESVRTIARVYLPPRPDESSSAPAPAAPAALATAVATVVATPVPTVYRGIPRPTVLRGIALE